MRDKKALWRTAAGCFFWSGKMGGGVIEFCYGRRSPEQGHISSAGIEELYAQAQLRKRNIDFLRRCLLTP